MELHNFSEDMKCVGYFVTSPYLLGVAGHLKIDQVWALQNRPPQCGEIYATWAGSGGSFCL